MCLYFNYFMHRVTIISKKVKNDHCSKFSNLSNWKKELNCKIYCDDHSSLSSTTAVQYEFHVYFTPFHCVTNVWLHSPVGRASHWYRRGHGFESHWSLDIFQVSSFQLLTSENLLQWSFLTFTYNRSTIWIIFHIYFTSFHCTGRYDLNKLTSLPMCGFTAQLVEHRTSIAEVTDSNPMWSPDIFQASSFQLLKLIALQRDWDVWDAKWQTMVECISVVDMTWRGAAGKN